MPPPGFLCKRCGHCCTDLSDSFRNTASKADMARWLKAGRWDILRHVHTLMETDEEGHNRVVGWRVWIEPETGSWCESACPWLCREAGLAACALGDLRPDYCRDFPLTRSHAEDVGCPGFWA